jgi:hypothetical protein
MKLKFSILLLLAVSLTAGLWLWIHHPASTAGQPVAQFVKPGLVSLPASVPINAPKMVTVTSRPAVTPAQMVSPETSDWTAVQKIVDDHVAYEDRLQAIRSLSSQLTDLDWEALRPFLLKPDGLDREQLGQVLKNNLLDALCAINPPPAGLGDVLAQIYRNRQQDDVVRDYAVQHMTAYYEQTTTQPDNAKAQQNIEKALWEAVAETDDSIGGTALLALKRLSQEYPGFDQQKIASTALQMAGDESAGELSHITSLQVCAQLGVADALPLALQAAQTGETISVKLSAIGVLGSLGGNEQVPFLNSILTGAEDRLKPVAQYALLHIATRQTQMASQK